MQMGQHEQGLVAGGEAAPNSPMPERRHRSASVSRSKVVNTARPTVWTSMAGLLAGVTELTITGPTRSFVRLNNHTPRETQPPDRMEEPPGDVPPCSWQIRHRARAPSSTTRRTC